MARNIRKIERQRPQIPARERVAAYARVSTEKDTMMHSLSAQVSYYSELIQRNPAWVYAGVYADNGLSGTSANRPEFQRLLADCRAGKIDRILTKSISRFTRNTVTLLETTRELKALGIDIYFEKENLHSISKDGELMLSIIASFAQEESRSVSDNMKWSIRKRFQKGELVNWRFMYGYHICKGRVEIHEPEAEIVRWVYAQYLRGTTVAMIAETLRERAIPLPFGGQWTSNRIIQLLKNEKYAGNALLQKAYVVDHISKQEKLNHGQLPRYFVEGSHPAIVSRETFEQAMALMECNRQASNIACVAPTFSAFTGMIRCPHCGKHYQRRATKYENAWACATYLKRGVAYCRSKKIPESILMETTASVLGLPDFDESIFRQRIREILVPEANHLIFVFQDGTEVERVWQDKSRADSWTPEMKQQAAEHARRRWDNE